MDRSDLKNNEIININGKECRIFGSRGPCFLYGYSVWQEGENDPKLLYRKTLEFLKDAPQRQDLDFVICAYRSYDWNTDFSPWKADAAFGDEPFSGGGRNTLAFLEQDLIPFLKNEYPEIAEFYPCGYSLCGLFSLWSLYESRLFNGCVCGSGSLWYPGWKEYTESRFPGSDKLVYLSLGKKEEKTKNRMMQTVGDATRRQDVLLSGCRHTLEWNQGGHFADSDERLAKGIKWILEVEQVREDTL